VWKIFLLAIALSVLLRLTVAGYHFSVFGLFLNVYTTDKILIGKAQLSLGEQEILQTVLFLPSQAYSIMAHVISFVS
jgi:hypothetical protein